MVLGRGGLKRTWGSAQVQKCTTFAQKVVFAVELDKLEGGTRAKPARIREVESDLHSKPAPQAKLKQTAVSLAQTAAPKSLQLVTSTGLSTLATVTWAC